ncbi:MAG: Rha family transcriptional regulator [Gammaproteobacteria bacterium]|nr:Rha family transcriptional regulator [Gammaproteobacteria bacterium]
MATIQVAPWAPHCSKRIFSERTGESISYIEKQIAEGHYPILPKESPNSAVRINLVALFAKNAVLAEQVL